MVPVLQTAIHPPVALRKYLKSLLHWMIVGTAEEFKRRLIIENLRTVAPCSRLQD